jgi:hypothetical protein
METIYPLINFLFGLRVNEILTGPIFAVQEPTGTPEDANNSRDARTCGNSKQ